MSYYTTQLNAFKDIDNLLNITKAGNQDADINYLIYEITKVHAISPKVVKERIKLWAEIQGIKILDNILKIEAR